LLKGVVTVVVKSGGSGSRRSRPATTPEGREAQLVALAFDLVEKRIREGNATSQETTHFLKLGSSREQLEQERLRNENLMTQAKIDQIAPLVKSEEMYAKAFKAMRAYAGQDPEPEDEPTDGYYD
jgi:hypothetical protein